VTTVFKTIRAIFVKKNYFLLCIMTICLMGMAQKNFIGSFGNNSGIDRSRRVRATTDGGTLSWLVMLSLHWMGMCL
jgi:hypothetical protein